MNVICDWVPERRVPLLAVEAERLDGLAGVLVGEVAERDGRRVLHAGQTQNGEPGRGRQFNGENVDLMYSYSVENDNM